METTSEIQNRRRVNVWGDYEAFIKEETLKLSLGIGGLFSGGGLDDCRLEIAISNGTKVEEHTVCLEDNT